jgi:hypothetical protein
MRAGGSQEGPQITESHHQILLWLASVKCLKEAEILKMDDGKTIAPKLPPTSPLSFDVFLCGLEIMASL